MAEMFSFAVTLKVGYDIRDNLQDTWNTLKEFWACHFMVTPQNATHLCITLLTPLTSARNITWLIYTVRPWKVSILYEFFDILHDAC